MSGEAVGDGAECVCVCVCVCLRVCVGREEVTQAKCAICNDSSVQCGGLHPGQVFLRSPSLQNTMILLPVLSMAHTQPHTTLMCCTHAHYQSDILLTHSQQMQSKVT